MATDIKQIKLIDLIPSSIANDEQVKAAAQALDLELQAVTAVIKETMLLSRLDELPETVIDLLAWQWHVDFWDEELTLVQKRKLVKNSIAWHRRKGTPSAVEEVVSTILGGAIVQEWFEYGGEPYYFRVIKIDGQVTEEMYPKLKRAIDAVKNVRSWIESVSLSRKVNSDIFYGVMQSTHSKVDIYPIVFKMPDIAAAHTYGAMTQTHKKITL